MAIDRDTLIELYKTTLEELRHQERVYVQALIGVVIIIPAFLVAVSFLFGGGSPVHSEYVPYVKGGIFGLGILLAGFLGLTIYRINKRFEVCIRVSNNIESKLLGVKTIEETSEFDGLLVRRELNEIEFEKRFERIRFWFYIPILVAIFIAFGLLLFVFVD